MNHSISWSSILIGAMFTGPTLLVIAVFDRHIDAVTTALLGGMLVGVLFAAPTTAVVMLIVQRRRDEQHPTAAATTTTPDQRFYIYVPNTPVHPALPAKKEVTRHV